MAKTAKHLTPAITHDLTPERTTCLHCGRYLRADYTNRRTITTLASYVEGCFPSKSTNMVWHINMTYAIL